MALGPAVSEDLIDQFSDDQIERYARQLVLPEIGTNGQIALRDAHMAVIGCGGLGANAALTLAQAGVGELSLYDPDSVELSNLHRQPFTADQVGENKTEALEALCRERNPNVVLNCFPHKFDRTDAPIWLDCTDSDASRRAIDQMRNPSVSLVFGSVIGMDAQVTVFGPNQPGFSALFPTPVDPTFRQSCADQGVLGPLAQLTAQIMAAEALKLAQGVPSALQNHLILIDARDWRFNRLKKSG